MNTNSRKAAVITLVLLASTLMLASFAVNTTKAQTSTQAVVILAASVGGTTSPAPGNYTYDNGTFIDFSAVPDPGFAFQYWIVSGAYTPGHTGTQIGYYTDPDTGQIVQLPAPIVASGIDSLVFTTNPANITCGYGYTYTYQAVFAPVSGTSTGASPTPTPPPQTLPAESSDQVINILPSIGGTTTPAPGTYSQANGTTITMTAIANDGFAFHYWIASGSYTAGHLAQPQYIPNETDQVPTVPSNIFLPTIDSLVFSINPVTITCGYGYTYSYQAVFVPVNSTVPVVPTSAPETPFPTFPPTPAVTTIPTSTTTTAPPVSTAPTASPATVTPTPTPAPGTNYTTWVIIAVVVIIVIIIIAVVAAMMMRRKK